MLKFRRQHVIGVVAERVIAQADVRRIVADLLAPSAEFLHPDIGDAALGHFDFQRFAVEVRHPARHGKRADVHQRADAVRLKRRHKFVERARGVPNGVNRRHLLDAFLCPKPASRAEEFVLRMPFELAPWNDCANSAPQVRNCF